MKRPIAVPRHCFFLEFRCQDTLPDYFLLPRVMAVIVFQTGHPARARCSPARCSPALCSPKPFSCRAVLGVGPNWRPRHGPMANFSGRAGTTPRTARWAVTRPGTIAGDAHGCGQWQSSAPRGLRRRRTRMQPVAQVHRPGAPAPAAGGQADAPGAPAPAAGGASGRRLMLEGGGAGGWRRRRLD
jgi:hypothetical protein